MRNSRRAGKPAGKKPEKQGLTGLFTKGKNIPTTAQQTLPYRFSPSHTRSILAAAVRSSS